MLVLPMSLLLAFAVQLISVSSLQPGTIQDTGMGEVSVGVIAFIGFFLMFGLACIVAGFWQVKYGERNQKILWVLLVMFIIFITVGLISRALH